MFAVVQSVTNLKFCNTSLNGFSMSEVLSVQLWLLISDVQWKYTFLKIIIYLLLSPDRVIYIYYMIFLMKYFLK